MLRVAAAVDERKDAAQRWYTESGESDARRVGEGLAGQGEVSTSGDKMFERRPDDTTATAAAAAAPGAVGAPPQVRALFGLHEQQDDPGGFFSQLLQHPKLLALAARLLGGCARAGEMSAEAALGALGEVRAEVGVENMTDEEVIPPLASVEGAQRPRL
eukprot:COSAG06_NODE_13386_length_1262_cov_1.465176_1_plen_159_part_00